MTEISTEELANWAEEIGAFQANDHDDELGRLAAARLRSLEAKNERMLEALNPIDRLPSGDWSVWTSNSYRRISSRGDGDILRAVTHPDGWPDLSWNEDTLQSLCDLVNGIRAALAQTKEQDRGD